jgi:hypothetical protein
MYRYRIFKNTCFRVFINFKISPYVLKLFTQLLYVNPFLKNVLLIFWECVSRIVIQLFNYFRLNIFPHSREWSTIPSHQRPYCNIQAFCYAFCKDFFCKNIRTIQYVCPIPCNLPLYLWAGFNKILELRTKYKCCGSGQFFVRIRKSAGSGYGS